MSAPRFLLEHPALFLQWLAGARRAGWASFDDVDVAQVFAIAAVAALGRHDGKERLLLHPATASGAARFAHAIGLDEAIDGDTAREPTEHDRTVSLTRIRRIGEAESVARRIVDLLLPAKGGSDSANLFWTVLVELLRNVVQHSSDPAGGIACAQRNDAGPYAGKPAVQVVVVDNGIGIFDAIRHNQPSVQTPAQALVHALEPHISGTFAAGGSGTVHNAGLGLFFISEMARQTNGRLFLATRGATYLLDRSQSATSQPVVTNGDAADYPGTLVVFETALDQIGSYDTIVARIHELASRRTPMRITNRWLRFEDPPPGVSRTLVDIAAEDTTAALAFSAQVLEPRLLGRQPIALDFRNLRICTQSFLHALLHESVRLAWARKVPMYVLNAAPTIRRQLEFVEAYSLGG